MVATFYVPFSVEHRMLSQIFNASQGRVRRREGRGVGATGWVLVCATETAHMQLAHTCYGYGNGNVTLRSTAAAAAAARHSWPNVALTSTVPSPPVAFPLPLSLPLPLLGVLCGTFHSIHLPFPVSIRFGRQLHNTKRVAWAQRGGGAWVRGGWPTHGPACDYLKQGQNNLPNLAKNELAID